MSNTHLVFTCAHAHPDYPNDRADYLARLIIDVRPDVVVNLGDAVDLPSLSSFEKGRKGFKGLTYERDINSHLDLQSRIWTPVLARKKRLPRRVFCIGNHEQRIQNAVEISPELTGTVSFADLQLSNWYDDIVPYEGSTPGVIEIDGVAYSHFFTSGIMGRAISSENMGQAILGKMYGSATMGHLHLLDISVRTTGSGSKIYGATVGCYQDYTNDWAGEIGKLWDRGVMIKRNVDKGAYDFEWISLDTLKNEYGY